MQCSATHSILKKNAPRPLLVAVFHWGTVRCLALFAAAPAVDVGIDWTADAHDGGAADKLVHPHSDTGSCFHSAWGRLSVEHLGALLLRGCWCRAQHEKGESIENFLEHVCSTFFRHATCRVETGCLPVQTTFQICHFFPTCQALSGGEYYLL